MKENNSGNRRKKLQERGYYIVLFLCVLAVGVSGYIFVSTAIRQDKTEQTLSVPLTAQSTPQKDKAAAASAVEEDLENDETEESDKPAKILSVAPVKGEVLQEFSVTELSYNPTTRDWRLHDAVDIAAEGQTVRACMAGTVTGVYDDEFLGTTVVLRHDGGYESRYSNLTAMPTVKVGESVIAGQTIGAVGETAILEANQEPHLHFQLLKNGTAVDPKEVLG